MGLISLLQSDFSLSMHFCGLPLELPGCLLIMGGFLICNFLELFVLNSIDNEKRQVFAL